MSKRGISRYGMESSEDEEPFVGSIDGEPLVKIKKVAFESFESSSDESIDNLDEESLDAEEYQRWSVEKVGSISPVLNIDGR